MDKTLDSDTSPQLFDTEGWRYGVEAEGFVIETFNGDDQYAEVTAEVVRLQAKYPRAQIAAVRRRRNDSAWSVVP